MDFFEHARRRPGMHIGSTDAPGMWCWVRVLINSAIGAYLAGAGSDISIALRADGAIRVTSERVTPPRVQHREMTTWTAEQARAFLAVAEAGAYGPIYLLALATGLRRSELLALRWADVDLERGILHVRQTAGKLGHGVEIKTRPKSASGHRAFRLPAKAVEALHAHKARQNERRLALGARWQDHGLVFPSETGTPVHPDNLRRDYDRLVKRAGVPRIRIHDQRHTHVTLALASGANIKAISRRIGHAQTSLTMDIYAHVLPEQHREVADKVGAILFGDTSPRAGARLQPESHDS